METMGTEPGPVEASATGRGTEQMRAVLQQSYGASGVWHCGERPRPAVRPGQVLVAVEAAAIDRGTWHLMTGRPYAARLAFGLRRPKNPVPGLDLSGRIVAIGPGVDQLAVGDEVFGAGNGSCAEYAVAAADRLTAKPAAWSWTEAAAAAVSGVTAWQAVHTAGRAVPGQRVLVLGASGGVGSFAVQIATAAGAAVTGVSSSAKTGFVRALGADEAIGYENAKLSERDRFDLVLDIGALLGGVGRSIGGALRSPFLRQRIVMLASAVRQRELAELAELGRDGRLTPAVDPHRFTLDDAAVAMNLLVAGGQRGKIVLRIGSEALSER